MESKRDITTIESKAHEQEIMMCDLSECELNKDITLSEIFDLAKNEPNDETITKAILYMLEKGGYHVLNTDLELLVKQRVVITGVATDKGRKFLKFVEKGCGDDEFEGGAIMSRYFPTIRTERIVKAENVDLIIQPYVSDIKIDQGMLTDVVGMLEYLKDDQKESRFWRVFEDVYKGMYHLTSQTLEHTVKPSKNDRFFYDRLKTKEQDGTSGRLEQFYGGYTLNLNGTECTWEDLKKKRWIIDGVEYQEILEECIAQAKIALSTENKRLIAVCHGDGHEMNIYTNALSQSPQEHRFAYLDMETAGENQVMGEGAIYLVYNSVMADYTVPKYYPEHFSERNRAMNASIDNMRNKIRPNMRIEQTDDTLTVAGAGSFGTSSIWIH